MEHAAELFEIPLEKFQVDESITEESSLWYKLEDPPRLLDAFDAVGKFVSYSLLPAAIAQRKIKSDLEKKVPEKVDRTVEGYVQILWTGLPKAPWN